MYYCGNQNVHRAMTGFICLESLVISFHQTVNENIFEYVHRDK